MIQLIAFLCLALCLTASAHPLTVTVKMDDFQEDGFDVTVFCTYDTTETSSVDGLVSLTISRRVGDNSTFQELVSVNALQQEQINKAENFDGTAQGVITPRGNGSYLEVQIKGVRSTEFQCQSTSINRFGHCIHETQTSNFSDIGLSISEMVKDMTELQEELENVKKNMKQLATVSRGLGSLLSAAYKEQQGSNFLWISEAFNTSVYAVLNDEDKCSDINGHLAEINSEEEFLFIQSTLRDLPLPSGKIYLLTGAQYDTKISPFKFTVHPNDPVYTGYWADGEPDRSSMTYNKLLLKFRSNDLSMADGRSHGSDLVYLCELPLV